jgi:hypothetical protein
LTGTQFDTVGGAMAAADGGLASLSRRQGRALRALLVGAVGAAGRRDAWPALQSLVDAAPLERLPDAAALHRVSGTVARGLESVDDVPPAVRRSLDAVRSWSTLHHLLVSGELSRIRRAFDDLELSWAVMKGPVAAARLYPDVGDRTYGDLDLLVDRRHFETAISTLEELGFAHHVHDWALAHEMLAGQVGMTRAHVSVDVHWHLHYSQRDRRPFALRPEAMLERTREVEVSGLTVPTFDRADSLLTLSFHAARSDGHRLLWLKDVERCLTVDRPDFDVTVERARAAGCAPHVGIMLGRAHRILAADVPDAVVEALVPQSLRAVEWAVTSFVPPVQLHERDTLTRAYTRSLRSSTAATLKAIPGRVASSIRRRRRPLWNETDDLGEKRDYLAAVVRSGEP